MWSIARSAVQGLVIAKFITILACVSLSAVVLSCDPSRVSQHVNDVHAEVVQLNDEVFRLDVENPNAVQVGARFRIRTYRYERVPPETELVHVYVPPQNIASHNIHTGGCIAVPPPEPEGTGETIDASECTLRVTATLLGTYYLVP